jgi:hypothetical protein
VVGVGQNSQVEGEQVGEKFGMAAAACDVTGDGLHDLIVGAPFYSPNNQVVELCIKISSILKNYARFPLYPEIERKCLMRNVSGWVYPTGSNFLYSYSKLYFFANFNC